MLMLLECEEHKADETHADADADADGVFKFPIISFLWIRFAFSQLKELRFEILKIYCTY